MPEYTPAYRTTARLSLQGFRSELEELSAIHAYAIRYDDLLALDELFCRVVTLEHRVRTWNETDQPPRVHDSIKALNRALKWAWLAREEEEHASGMYAGKMKEAIAVLEDMEIFLESVPHPEDMTVEDVPPTQTGEIEQPEPLTAQGMTREQAETLAATIKARLPQAEVSTSEEEKSGAWVVHARNPRRGTSQVFHSPEQFEQLMQGAARRPVPQPEEG